MFIYATIPKFSLTLKNRTLLIIVKNKKRHSEHILHLAKIQEYLYIFEHLCCNKYTCPNYTKTSLTKQCKTRMFISYLLFYAIQGFYNYIVALLPKNNRL